MVRACSVLEALFWGIRRRNRTGRQTCRARNAHRHHDTEDHETVTAPDAVAAFGRAVVLVRGAMHRLAVAVEQGVVDRDGDRAAVGHEAGHHHARQCQAYLVGVPHRAGEEPVRM